MNTYKNWVPVAYPPTDKGMPVPGWDMRKRMAGSRTIAIGDAYSAPAYGAFPAAGQQKGIIIYGTQGRQIGMQKAMHGLGLDMTIQTPLGPQKVSIPLEEAMDQAIGSAVQKAWPQIQPKLHAELESAAEGMQQKMRRDMIIAAAALVGAMIVIEMVEWKKLKV